jgi:predicted aminopeptidase
MSKKTFIVQIISKMDQVFFKKNNNGKKIFIIYFYLLFLTPMLTNCMGYLSHLAIGQTEILWKREKISIILSSTNDDMLKKKIQLIHNARRFASSDLYLNPEGGFEYYTKLDRDEVGWHITASYPLKFESFTWWFPIVGNVPYKGFFELQKAREEENDLIQKGLDTRLRITSGYSTLGWFSDPLLSPQLRLQEDELIALVFHEMAHSTVYFNGDSDFNESYASFIEEIGTIKYYKSINNQASNEIIKKRNVTKLEKKIIFDIVKEYGEILKNLYESNISDEDKLKDKKMFIEEFRAKVLEKTSKFEYVNTKNFHKAIINNETFLGVLRYNSGEKFFQDQYEKSGYDLKRFHTEIKNFKNVSKEDRQKLLKL